MRNFPLSTKLKLSGLTVRNPVCWYLKNVSRETLTNDIGSYGIVSCETPPSQVDEFVVFNYLTLNPDLFTDFFLQSAVQLGRI